MLSDAQLEPIRKLKLSEYPAFCVWDNSIVRTKILSMIWSLTGERQVNVLDIGCGAARMWRPIMENMSNISLYGFDPFKGAVHIAQERLDGLNAHIRQGDVSAIDDMFPQVEAFDFIVSHSVLEHVVPRHLYFRAIANRLSNKGVALISWGGDHFRQGLRTDIRNRISQVLAVFGVERYYAREVDERWARHEIAENDMEINVLHHYSLVELKKIFKLVPEHAKVDVFQNWIQIEEELNREIRDDSFQKKMDETLAVITKK